MHKYGSFFYILIMVLPKITGTWNARFSSSTVRTRCIACCSLTSDEPSLSLSAAHTTHTAVFRTFSDTYIRITINFLFYFILFVFLYHFIEMHDNYSNNNGDTTMIIIIDISIITLKTTVTSLIVIAITVIHSSLLINHYSKLYHFDY